MARLIKTAKDRQKEIDEAKPKEVVDERNRRPNDKFVKEPLGGNVR